MHVQGLLLTESDGRWEPGVEAVLPGNAAATGITNPTVYIDSVSCASAGNCSAVGAYVDSSGIQEGLLLNEIAGSWQPGVEAVPPPNPEGGAGLLAVSCSSAGNCSAVGVHAGGGLLLTETDGTWAPGIAAQLPANGIAGYATAISCASAGNCTAVGSYAVSWQDDEGLLLTETDGRWSAVEATTPAPTVNGYRGVGVDSVSCWSAGNCSAVGSYKDDVPASPNLGSGVLLTETNGVWAPGATVALWRHAAPDNVSVSDVSCASAGNCAAVGTSNGQGLLLTEKDGVWSSAVKAVVPPDAKGKRHGGDFVSVSCASAGNCSAVGDSLLVTEKAGKWAPATNVVIPRGDGPPTSLTSVSCGSAQNCSAVGNTYPVGGVGLLTTSSAAPSAELCVVPSLVGNTLSAASRSIKAHNCSLGRIKHATSQKITPGHVISQKPKPGRRLRHGAKISLTVSKH
jgi:hypothetical protein